MRELDPSSWVKSFTKVNLHPHHCVDLPTWCTRISHFLQGGESFKSEKEEKTKSMTIFKSHESKFSAPCLKELSTAMRLPFSDMQTFRLCLELAEEDPSHL